MSNDMHNDFKEKMQEAWDCYVADEEDIEIPEPDLTFLDESNLKNKEEVNHINMELDFLTPPKKRNTTLSRFGKVAVIIIAILVTSSAIGIFLDSEASYGVKSIIQNVKHFFSPNQEAKMNSDGEETLEVRDWNDIGQGKGVVGTLYYPEYIPKGYSFKNVTFEKTESLKLTDYEFVKGEKQISVFIEYMEHSGDVLVDGEPYTSPLSGSTMYLSHDQDTDTYIITYLKDQYVYMVTSSATKEETVKIIESIKEVD